MSNRHSRIRVRERECGRLGDPDRQDYWFGIMSRDMGRRRALKSMMAQIKRNHRLSRSPSCGDELPF